MVYRELSFLESRFFTAVDMHATHKLEGLTKESMSAGDILCTLVLGGIIGYSAVEKANFSDLRPEEWQEFHDSTKTAAEDPNCTPSEKEKLTRVYKSIERHIERDELFQTYYPRRT